MRKGIVRYFLTGGNRTPLNLVAVTKSSTEIDLTWSGGQLAKVERSTDGINYIQIGTGNDSYSDTGLTEGCLYYYRVKIDRYSNSASDITWPSVISDTNTWGWYKWDDLTTITKDGSNRVSAWADKLGGVRTLAQADDAKKPIYDINGLLFDGVDDLLRYSEYFAQPCIIYALIKQVTWNANMGLLGGGGPGAPYIYMAGSSPNLRGIADVVTDPVAGLAVDTWGIIRFKIDGSSSRLGINADSPATKTFDARQMQGITLGSNGETACSNVRIKEVIVRNVADSAPDEASLYSYLVKKKSKYPINPISIPRYLTDSNTVGWFDAFDIETITKDDSDIVSLWKDKSGKGHDFKTGSCGWDADKGMIFNGIDQYLKTDSFPYEQPEFIYMVIKNLNWAGGDNIMDGYQNNTGILTEQYVTPQIIQHAGLNGATFDDLWLNEWTILRILFKDADSFLKAFNDAYSTSDPGSADMNGITLGRYGQSSSFFGNFLLKEAIFRNKVDSDSVQSIIYNYLHTKHFTFRGKVLIIGDSISVNIDNYLRPLRDYDVTNIAVGGANITSQHSAFTALADKGEYDYIFCMLGANHYTLTASETLTQYQALIDDIVGNKKAGCKLYLSTITPMLESVNWSGKDALWHTLNEAINGDGATPLTDMDDSIDNEDLGDANHYLLAANDNGDHLHLNGTGVSAMAVKYAAKIL